MSLRPSVRTTNQRWADRLGPRADDPLVPTAILGLGAFVFSFCYYGNMLTGHRWEIAQGNYEAAVGLGLFFVVTVVNAVVVTWAVWSLLEFGQTWSYRYGAGSGLLVALVSHLTLGFGVIGIGFVTGTGPAQESVVDLLFYALYFGLASIPFSLGIPILMCVTTGVWLTYARRRAVD